MYKKFYGKKCIFKKQNWKKQIKNTELVLILCTFVITGNASHGWQKKSQADVRK